MDPKNEGTYVSKALVCHACMARDKASDAWHENKGDSAGLLFSVAKHHH